METRLVDDSSHTTILLITDLQVETDSSMFAVIVFKVAIIVVLQLPPNESRSTEVIIEFRYGMCVRDRSPSATITCSR